jgi:hypothetical protein
VTVKLQVEVTRDVDQRLIGTVRLDDWQLAFDGTLELMRVFEEFVPCAVGDDPHQGGSGGAEAGLRPSK